MKKKLVAATLAAACAVSCAFGLAACSDGNGGGGAGDGDLTKAEISTLFKNAAASAWVKLGAGDPSASATAVAASALVPDETEEVGADRLKAAKANAATMIANVKMIGDYYENENFVVTEKAVTFDIQTSLLTGSAADATVTLLPTVDKENEILAFEMLIIVESKPLNAYYNFEIGYDFDGNDGVTSYHLVMVQDQGEHVAYTDSKMEGGKFYEQKETLSEGYKTAVNALHTAFEAKKTDGLTLTGNFADEFNSAMTLGGKAFANVMGGSGGSGGSGDSGGEIKPGVSTEVTSVQWTEILESITQFTIDMSQNGSHVTTIKIDGAKRSQESSQGKQIFVKDGEDYFQFSFDNSVWTKSDLKPTAYETYTEHNARLISYFKDDFNSFTFSDVVYTAQSIDKTETMHGVVNNVMLSFADGALTGMEFDAAVGSSVYKYVFKEIGNTVIELPTEFTDESGGN